MLKKYFIICEEVTFKKESACLGYILIMLLNLWQKLSQQ